MEYPMYGAQYGESPLAVIARVTILVPYHVVKSLLSLDFKTGHQDNSLNNGHQGDMSCCTKPSVYNNPIWGEWVS